MILALAVSAASLAIASATFADPLVGRDLLKFSQQPMDGTPFVNPNGTTQLFWGHDELSTAYSQVTATGPTPYRGTFMADDFADKFASPVVHVKWWGSYFPSLQPTNIPINKFLISFESDQPVDANNPFSRPRHAAVESNRQSRAACARFRHLYRNVRSVSAARHSTKRCTSTMPSCIWARNSFRSRTQFTG